MTNLLPVCLQNYTPAKISSTFPIVRTVEDALAIDEPCLRALDRVDGSSLQSVKVMLKMHLVALDKFLKQKEGLGREEIELIADEVIETYGGMLNFADVHVVFRNAKLGKYGELYNNISCAKVVKWFADYASARCEAAYEMNLQADKARYGHSVERDGEKVLHDMGYRVGEDGRISIDQSVVAANDARRKAEQERQEAKKRAKHDDNVEYLKWKLKMKEEGLL